MKTLKIIIVSVFVAVLTITAVYMTGCTDSKATTVVAKAAMVTYTVEEVNALIASEQAIGSQDFYTDSMHQDCYIYMMYQNKLFAPEVEYLYDAKTGKWLTETKCYNSIQ